MTEVIKSTEELPEAVTSSISQGLGGHTAHGFVSTLISTGVIKASSFIAQILLALFLTKQDFGLAAMVVAAAILPGQIKEFGTSQLLLRHPKRYAAWASDAMWLIAAQALVAAIITVSLAPLIGGSEHRATVWGLVIILAISTFVSGLSAIPFTTLSIDLSFKLSSRIASFVAIVSTATSIVLAISGCGPYAIVLPILLGGILRLIVGIWVAPVCNIAWPRLTRWRVMLADGWKLFLGMLFFQIIWQCDYLILGAFRGEAEVGVYYFAFTLAAQSIVLVSANVATILLPVLGHMSDDWKRQQEALARVTRYLAAVGFPICFVQAAIGTPLVHWIWHDKWVDAVPAFAALSLGWSMRLVGLPAMSLIQAQGRFLTMMFIAMVSAVNFLVIVSAAARIGGATTVAVAVAVFYLAMEFAIGVIAFGSDRPGSFSIARGFRTVTYTSAVPLLSGVAGGLAAYSVVYLLPSHIPFLALIIAASTGFSISIFITKCLAPDLASFFAQLILVLIRRRSLADVI